MRRFRKHTRQQIRTFTVVREAVRPTPALRAAESNKRRREAVASVREAVAVLVSLPTIAAMLVSDRQRRLEAVIARFWRRLGIESPDAQLASEAGRWFDHAIFAAGETDGEAIAAARDADAMERVGTDYVPYSRLVYASGRAYVADAGDCIAPAQLHALAHVRDAARRSNDGTQSTQERTDVHQAAWLVVRQQIDTPDGPLLRTLVPSQIDRHGLEFLLCEVVRAAALRDNGSPVIVSVYSGTIVRNGVSKPIWLTWNILRESNKRKALFATSHKVAAARYVSAADSIDMRLDAMLDIGPPTGRDSRTVERWHARRDALVRRSLESAQNAQSFAEAPSRARPDRALAPAEVIGRGFVALVTEAVASVIAANVAIASPLVNAKAARLAAARAKRANTTPAERAYAAQLRNGAVRDLSDAEYNRAGSRFAQEHVTSETTDARAARLAQHWADVRNKRARDAQLRDARRFAQDARLADSIRCAAWSLVTARRYQRTEATAQRSESFYGFASEYRTYRADKPLVTGDGFDQRAARLRRKATARLACVRWNVATEATLRLTEATDVPLLN